eukprot:SM000017S02855  [mRNA]  locus=s17:656742:657725:- [translate_table: standard]
MGQQASRVGSRAVSQQLQASKAQRKTVPETNFGEPAAPPAPRSGSAADVPARPAPPEPRPIIEPGQDISEWDRSTANYQTLTQQIAGTIQTRPGDPAIKGETRPRQLPLDRHTGPLTGLQDDAPVEHGKVNAIQLRELLREYALEPSKVAQLASRYEVDEVLLKLVVQYVSHPPDEMLDQRDSNWAPPAS